jgi:chemotaxis protein MotB
MKLSARTARRRPPTPTLLATILGALALAGCSPTQADFDAKVRELEATQARLAAAAKARAKLDDELADAQANIEQLKKKLLEREGESSNLEATVREQRAALEEFQRRAKQLEAIQARFELLKQKLEELTKFGLSVAIRKNRIVIQLPGDVLFDSGKETLKPEGQTILTRVAEVIRNDRGLRARSYQVAGHTDNQPFRGVFKDNWGLSAMRAREVLVFLVSPVGDNPSKPSGGGLDPQQWSAVGYGDTDPVADNAGDLRSQNRRVELVVMPNVEEMIDLKALTTR